MSEPRIYSDPLSPNTIVSIENQWVNNETYAEIAQKTIITCADVIFFNKTEKIIWLGKRVVYPQKDVWCFGGRRLFNDQSPKDSIVRLVKTETGLQIPKERFNFLCVNEYTWVKVAQGDFPGKSSVTVFSCEVTDKEVEQMNRGLSKTEYDLDFGLQKFDRVRLIADNIHPAMLDIYHELFGYPAAC